MRLRTLALLLTVPQLLPAADDDSPPKSLDPRLTIELFAEHPQLRTPTGIDVDARGRVWVIESNTHFRPENYGGHPSDRLLILTDTDNDGRADDVKTFADGFRFAMSMAVRPVWMSPVLSVKSPVSPSDASSPSILDTQHSTQQVFLAERSGIWLLEDTDGDDACDRRTQLVTLQTEGNYPHNGLAGFAFDALGWMYFGLGENLGAPYKLVSRESRVSSVESPVSPEVAPTTTLDAGHSNLNPLAGGGEGGNLYRMRPDGSQLTHWATGFWNPHASCVDAFGRVFTVDNDADSRPPCRLLHIIEGGDYGFRFRNGRKGLHPFTSWNGEIPGTLPMVAGTGEAPSGILAYEHDAFPEEYLGNLLVTSWGDHRIDRFRLKEKGASFESIAEPVITGGENFRPVGIALAPDGSLFISDWVLKDYNLHGKGRVWRVRANHNEARALPPTGDWELLWSPRLPERRSAARRLIRTANERRLADFAMDQTKPRSSRYEAMIATVLDVRHRESVPPSTTDQAQAAGDLLIASIIHATLVPAEAAAGKQSVSLDSKHPGLFFPMLKSMDHADVIARNPPAFAQATLLLHARDDPVLLTLARDFDDFRKLAPRTAYEWTRWRMGGELFLGASSHIRHSVLGLLLTRRVEPDNDEVVAAALADSIPQVRRLAVQWAAEDRLIELRPQVEAVLKSEPMTTDLFLATLAALEMLDGKDPKDFDQTPPGKYVLPLLSDPAAPAAVKTQALRLVDPADPGLTLELLESLLASDDTALRLEAIRSLSGSLQPEAVPRLAELAQRRLERDEGGEHEAVLDREEREALLGLAAKVDHPDARTALLELLPAPLPYRADVIRALRAAAGNDPGTLLRVRQSVGEQTGAAEAWAAVNAQLPLITGPAVDSAPAFQPPPTPPRPDSDNAWGEAMLAATEADNATASPTAGERIFFHPNGPRCYQCHTVNGRGGRIGPDLSRVGAALSREKLLDSILNPSKEVAPQFTTWNCVTTAGVVYTGMIVFENKGETTLGSADGKLVTIPTIDIETRTPQPVSVMPEKLEDRLTVTELRDLLAFLESLK
jgi:putative membrane-bound dehydrogenase-like protein